MNENEHAIDLDKRDAEQYDFVDLGESFDNRRKRENSESDIDSESDSVNDSNDSDNNEIIAKINKRSDDEIKFQEEDSLNQYLKKKKRSIDLENYDGVIHDLEKRSNYKRSRLNESLNNLNASLNLILSLSSDNGNFVWNMINPVAQFILLNQTQILALSFDINALIKQNVSYLSWSNLPDNVRGVLLSQNIASLLSLTFAQWGWVDENSNEFNSTLYALLPARSQILLPKLSAVLAPLDLSLKINKPPKKLHFLDTFFRSFLRINRKDRQQQNEKQNNHFESKSIAKQAWQRANKFLKSLDL